MIDLSGLDLRSDAIAASQAPVPDVGVILHHDDRSGFIAAIGGGRVKRASDYGRLESDRVVGPISFNAERPHVRPLLHRRQQRNIGGQGLSRPGTLSMPNFHAPLTTVRANL